MKQIAYDQMYENELTHAWYIGTRKVLTETLKSKLNKDAKILDAGCGTGGTITALNKSGFKNVYGIDKSPYALYFCKKRRIKSVKLSSIDEIPFKDNHFDAVICLDVLYHKRVNRQKALKEFKRVLKKNGILYSQEPAHNWLKSSHDTAIETENRFSKSDVENLAQNAGFAKVKSTYFNFFFLSPIIVSRIKNRLIPKSTKDSDVNSLSPVLNYIFLIALKLEANLVKVINFPMGVSIISIWKK